MEISSGDKQYFFIQKNIETKKKEIKSGERKKRSSIESVAEFAIKNTERLSLTQALDIKQVFVKKYISKSSVLSRKTQRFLNKVFLWLYRGRLEKLDKLIAEKL